MPRAINGVSRARKRKKILKITKGFWGRRKSNFRVAKDAAKKAMAYSYRDRKNRKRDFRRLWIIRISSALKSFDMNYSTFMNLLSKSNIILNRKAISNLAVEDFDAFEVLVAEIKETI